MVQIKRIYDPAALEDGTRILVDRIWPRGVSKGEAKIDRWSKDLAPSEGLRKWFAHDPAKWGEFEIRYAAELRDRKLELEAIVAEARHSVVTLVYSARDPRHNQAVVLKHVIETLML